MEKQTNPQGQSEVKNEEVKGVAVAEPPKPTTSQKLFAHLAGRDIPAVKELFPSTPKPEEKAEPKTEAKKEEPEPEVKPEKKTLVLDEYKDHLLKLKVDGVEEEATLSDVIRRVQLDQHITKKSQRLSEEEKRLKERETVLAERERIAIELLAGAKGDKKPDPAEESVVKDDPLVKKLETELTETRGYLKSLQEQMRPFLLEQSIDRAAARVKDTLGTGDFKEYRGKILNFLTSLPPEQAAPLDTEDGWIGIYKDLKLRELMEKSTARPVEDKTMERPAPAVVPVESGKSAPSGDVDDVATKKRNLLERAKRLTAENSREKDAAWHEYLEYSKKIGEAPE